MEPIKIARVRDVKMPQRGTDVAAGIDFFVPNDFTRVKVYPNEDILIPSGIRANIAHGYMMMAADKSGVVTSAEACRKCGRTPKEDAFESNVIIGAKIVDEDYTGEIHIHLINVGKKPVTIKPGAKIAQFIVVPVSYVDVEECSEDELFVGTQSQRGEGGFGSTGSK